jgi:uncharacterized RDD family membrane protein YckC
MTILLLKTNDDVFLLLSYWQKIKLIYPDALITIFWISNIWLYSELIILFTNGRRRSFQDFIAGTVVVKTKYLNRIKEIQKSTVQ